MKVLMRRINRITSTLLCVFLVFVLVACENNHTKEQTITVVFSEKILNVAEVSPEEWKEQLDEFGRGQYLSLGVSDNGKTVTMEITSAQKEFWISVVNRELGKLKSDMHKVNNFYNINYNEDYSCIDFYYNLDLPVTDAMYYVLYGEVYCVFGQLLNDVDPNSWMVSFNIYNSDTGKLVTKGNSDTGLSYEEEDWEDSK